MSATCSSAVPSFVDPARVSWPQNIVADVERLMKDRIERRARELFESRGCPPGTQWSCRQAAERELSVARARVVECPDTVTVFAFVPEAPPRRLSIFLTSRGVAIRSRAEGEENPTTPEQFLIARWSTEIDPHTVCASLDGTLFSLTGWRVASCNLKNRFKLWSLSGSCPSGIPSAPRRALARGA